MKVTKRRGAWVVDFYDFGKRRVKVFPTKRDAEDFGSEQRRKTREQLKPQVHPHITIAEYAALFLSTKAPALDLKPKTQERLRSALEGHVLPALGHHRVRELDRPAVRTFLESKLAHESSLQGQKGKVKIGTRKLARGTVLYLLHTVSALMREAVEDQLIASNPLRGLGRALNLGKRKRGQQSEVKAFTQPQLVRFLTMARDRAPDVFPAFATMSLAGLRVGEALALKWDAVDFEAGRLHIREQLSGSTKDDEEREVEIADALRAILSALLARQRESAFREGRTISGFALFPEFAQDASRKAEARVVKIISRRMQRILKLAELPEHHTPHSLRHSFASILISKGRPIAYVQQALGHASISMTVDIYGSWLPVEATGAVNLLAEGLNLGQPVTNRAATGNTVAEGCPQVLEATGTSSPRPAPCPRSPCTCT
jgi:integrase